MSPFDAMIPYYRKVSTHFELFGYAATSRKFNLSKHEIAKIVNSYHRYNRVGIRALPNPWVSCIHMVKDKETGFFRQCHRKPVSEDKMPYCSSHRRQWREPRYNDDWGSTQDLFAHL